MTRTMNVTLVNPDLKRRCKGEDAVNIRDLLDIYCDNSLVAYTSTKDDHRYHQGYLQALEDVRGAITNT